MADPEDNQDNKGNHEDPEAHEREKIALWLQQGLDAYGEGDTGTAIRTWRQVLAVEPQNADALDFIDTAERSDFPRAEEEAGHPETDGDRDPSSDQIEATGCDVVRNVVREGVGDVVGEARRLIAAGQFEESLALLRHAASGREFSFELEARIELVRGNLYASYRACVGDLSSVPTVVAEPIEITHFNLPKDAGFLLSLVDGITNLENLVTVSGMDSFEVLRTTKNLIDVGIVRMQP